MDIKQDILATLSYFDIFNYPLTQTETSQFLRNTYPNGEIAQAMNELAAANWIFKFKDFYTLQDDRALIGRRKNGNIRARKMLATASKIAGFLSRFPFVRGVAVSGSLSKNFADESSDIDFFIITSKNRLWIARTIMHVFKKFTFLIGKQDLFCMNYYVDERMLQIKEKNIYTAIEVATLLPMRGFRTFQKFYRANDWCNGFLPNFTMKISYMEEMKDPLIKKIFEFIFNNPAGSLLDHLLMKITSRRWEKKTRKMKLNKRGIIMGMDANKHYAKPNPENFQRGLIDLYEKKIYSIFRKYNGKLKSVH